MANEVELYKEKVKTFDLQGKLLGMQDRTNFYEEIRREYKAKKKVTRQVHTIRLFLVNSNGGLYVTKRSRLKKENSKLYDKTIGAHIRGDESVEYTVLRECAEELGFPGAMLRDEEFITGLLETDLRLMGIFKKIETINNFQAKYKYTTGGTVVFPQITTIVLGVYDGPLKFQDGEISGLEMYYREDLLKDMKDAPQRYTNDLRILYPKYIDEIERIIKTLREET